MPSTADSMSTSSKTTTGALPPSSRWARLRSFAAAVATAMPARVDPVIETSWGMGCSVSAAPVSRSPQIRLQTPGGKMLLHLLHHPVRRRRRGVRRLEDDGVARGKGRGELPDRHHHRVVPRGHLRDGTDRLATYRAEVNPRMYSPLERPSSTRAAPAKNRIWSTIGGISSDIVRCDRLAGVLGLDGDELLGVLLDHVGEP